MIFRKLIACPVQIGDLLGSYINKMTREFEQYVSEYGDTVKLFNEYGFNRYSYESPAVERYYQHLNNLYVTMYHFRLLHEQNLDSLSDVENYYQTLSEATHSVDGRREQTGMLGLFRDYVMHINNNDKKQAALIDIKDVLSDVKSKLTDKTIEFMEKFIIYHDVFKLVSEMNHEALSAFVYSSVVDDFDPVMELCIFWHVLLNPVSQDGAVGGIFTIPEPNPVKLNAYPEFDLSSYVEGIGRKSAELFKSEEFDFFKDVFLLTTVLDSMGSRKETPVSRFQYRKMVLSLDIMTQIKNEDIFNKMPAEKIRYLGELIDDNDKLFSILFSQMTLATRYIDDYDTNRNLRDFLDEAFVKLIYDSPALNGDLKKIKTNITRIVKYNYVHNIFFYLLADQPFFKAEFADESQHWSVDNAVYYFKFRFLLALMVPDGALVQYNCDYLTLLDKENWLNDFKSSIDVLWDKRLSLSHQEFSKFLSEFYLTQDEYRIQSR